MVPHVCSVHILPELLSFRPQWNFVPHNKKFIFSFVCSWPQRSLDFDSISYYLISSWSFLSSEFIQTSSYIGQTETLFHKRFKENLLSKFTIINLAIQYTLQIIVTYVFFWKFYMYYRKGWILNSNLKSGACKFENTNLKILVWN